MLASMRDVQILSQTRTHLKIYLCSQAFLQKIRTALVITNLQLYKIQENILYGPVNANKMAS